MDRAWIFLVRAWQNAAFVLIPLNEVAPHAINPGHHKTVAQLLQTLLSRSESEAHAVVPIQSDISTRRYWQRRCWCRHAFRHRIK